MLNMTVREMTSHKILGVSIAFKSVSLSKKRRSWSLLSSVVAGIKKRMANITSPKIEAKMD